MASLLKDLYSQAYIETLANDISRFYPNFNTKNFIVNIFDASWEEKELKQRMRHISTTMHNHINLDYQKTIEVLMLCFDYRKKSKEKRDENLALENMIFADFVEMYGLNDFELSMKALECFTQYSSSEFAIRVFILKYEEKTISQLKQWTKSKSEHTRRLASEGCRSRLPWANTLVKYKKDPTKVIEILELLKYDSSKYVQKSVANNLNDISKDNIKIVKNLANKWIDKTTSLNWIIKHGCRTLLKSADKDILKLFGYTISNTLTISNIFVSSNVQIGDKLSFSFLLKDSKNLGKLRLEYAINFVRLKGKSSRKLFKIKEGIFDKKSLEISKLHSFKKINTRVYYEGLHSIEFIVNGKIIHTQEFYLVKEEISLKQ